MELQSHSLAIVCVWTTELPDMIEHHEAMERDIQKLLSEGKQNKLTYGVQTLSILQTLKGDHWTKFFNNIRLAVRTAIGYFEMSADESRVQLRAWASYLRSKDVTETSFRLNSLHSHAPAFVSGVYYLRAPNVEPQSSIVSGTYFVNPVSYLPQSISPGLIVTSLVGRLVLFPSAIMHAPCVNEETLQRSDRLVIGFDAHFTPM